MTQQFCRHISSCARAFHSSSNSGLLNLNLRLSRLSQGRSDVGVGGIGSPSTITYSPQCDTMRKAFYRQFTTNGQQSQYSSVCTSQVRQRLPSFHQNQHCWGLIQLWNVNTFRHTVTLQSRLYSNSSREVTGRLHSKLLSKRLNDRKGRTLASERKSNEASTGDSEKPTTEQLTLYQRFKKTYKEHGKVLVCVHVATSAVWYGTFYTAAKLGLDIVPYLEWLNFSDQMIKPFKSGGLGDFALAYLLYKLATPARYTVTIGGTNLVIKFLRKGGVMKPIAKEDTLRAMYKEGKADLRKTRDIRVKRMKVRFNKSRIGRLKQRQRAGRDKNKTKR